MRIFISGGCKNGKSYYAQYLAKAQLAGKLIYVATMEPGDHEDQERILRHQKEREGWGFETIECPTHVERLIEQCDPMASILFDSITALLANEMFKGGTIDMDAPADVCRDLTGFVAKTTNLVIVSDAIYCDDERYDSYTEAYRKGLALLDRSVAAICDVVLEMVYGNLMIHKGKEVFALLYEKAV